MMRTSISKFSDMTHEEFARHHHGLEIDHSRVKNFAAVAPTNVTRPDEID